MKRRIYIILSALSLLNIVLIPSFSVWSGLFPSDYENTFLEAVKTLLTDIDAIHYWSVIVVLSIFVPSVLMLLSAVFSKKALFSLSSALGIILWFRTSINYAKQDGIEDFFDFQDGNFSIGFWIALILFIAALIVGITSKKDDFQAQPIENQKNYYYPPNSSTNQVVVEKGDFCPNCGNKIDKESVFCGNCGYKL